MEVKSVTTPVLFIAFARPEYARQTFNAIKDARPQNLYFYSNKARVDNPDEILRNNTVRDLINEIDWDCNLKTFFRDEYVDVYTSVRSAINWIFQNEENAIILEEDCVASVSFFGYCESLLHIYENNQRVWLISGNNFIENQCSNNYSFYFSRNPHTYGWASWRSRWEKLESDLRTLPTLYEYNSFRQLYSHKIERRFMLALYMSLYRKNDDQISWDYLLMYTMLINDGLGIVPSKNLVSNIGVQGENNAKKGKHNLLSTFQGSLYEIDRFPPFTIVDYKFDLNLFKHYHYNISYLSLYFFIFVNELHMRFPLLLKLLKKNHFLLKSLLLDRK